MTNLSVGFASLDDLGSIKNFLRKQWGPNHWVSQNSVLDFFSKSSPKSWFDPYRHRGHIPIVVARKGLELVGVQVLFPFNARWKEFEMKASLDIEWVGNSRHRGVGQLLAEYTLSESALVCGIGYNESALAAIGRNRRQVFTQSMARIVFTLNPRALRLWQESRGLPLDSVPSAEASFVSAPSEQGDFLEWGDFMRDNPCNCLGVFCSCEAALQQGARGSGWFKWRYLQCPSKEYRVFRNSHDARHYVVLRVLSVPGTTRGVVRILNLSCSASCDFCTLRQILAHEVWRQALFIDYLCSNALFISNIASRLWGRGIGSAISPRIPYLFQPLELRAESGPVVAVTTGSDAGLPSNVLNGLAADGFFGFSSADADQDRW